MKKAEINYLVDLGIGIAFLLSAISGLVFLIPIDFTASSTPTVLWISLSTWDTLHTWGSLALIAGVMVHMILHWKWFISMTRRMLSLKRKGSTTPKPVPANAVTRRQFLYFASGAAAAALLGGLLARREVGAAVEMASATDFTPNQSSGSQQPVSTNSTLPITTPEPSPTATPEVLATSTPEVLAIPTAEPIATATPTQVQQLRAPICSRGCSYPGHCRRYTDQNSNGICDLTEWI